MTANDESKPLRYRATATVRRQPPWPEIEPDAGAGVRLRLRALEEVLCRLPPAAYQALRQSALQLRWRVEGCWLGRLTREGGVPVVELAECLERDAWPIVVTVVVHELAHAVLGHAADDDPGVQKEQELGAWNELRKWGFGLEADAAEFLLSHRTG